MLDDEDSSPTAPPPPLFPAYGSEAPVTAVKGPGRLYTGYLTFNAIKFGGLNIAGKFYYRYYHVVSMTPVFRIRVH